MHWVVEKSWIVYSFSFIDVDYCQFSDWGYKKPTRLWVSPSLSKVANMLCDPHTCSQMVDGNDGKGGRRVHREHLGGKQMKVSTRQKERMPSALVNYLLQGVLFSSPSSEEKTVLEVCLENRWLGKISSVPSPLQLLVELDVELPDGRLQRAKALIDTGAEVDLVRSGFVPRHLFFPAAVPMVFIMANGSSKLGGGSQTVELCFRFSQESVGSSEPEPFVTRHTFYEADIHVDLILGHPWMAQECVGVFPHLGCLARVGPPWFSYDPL